MVIVRGEELVRSGEYGSCLQRAFHRMAVFSRTIQDCLTEEVFFLPLGLGSHLGKIVWNFPSTSVQGGGTFEVRATLALAGGRGGRGGKGQGEAAGEP